MVLHCERAGRPVSALRVAATALLMGLIAPAALAQDNWFVNADVANDRSWGTAGNWTAGLPAGGTGTVHVSDLKGNATYPKADGFAKLLSASSASHVTIGGWSSGSPPNSTLRSDESYGRLDILDGGKLTIGASGDSRELRIGQGGALGEVNQYVEWDQYGASDPDLSVLVHGPIVLGDGGARSTGTYNLLAGSVQADQLHVGAEGSGTFRISGVTIRDSHTHPHDPPLAPESAGVVTISGPTYIGGTPTSADPALGVLHIDDGTFNAEEIWVGSRMGSAGSLVLDQRPTAWDVSDNDNHITPLAWAPSTVKSSSVTIGSGGQGTEFVLAGSHEVTGSYQLGTSVGSYGRLIVRQGSIEITDSLTIGSADSFGRGEVRIEGPGGGVDVGPGKGVDVTGDLHVTDRGRITMVLYAAETGVHVTPVTVHKSVVFDADSEIDIQLSAGSFPGGVDGFDPSCNQTFVLIDASSASSIPDFANAQLIHEDRSSWALLKPPATGILSAQYLVCP